MYSGLPDVADTDCSLLPERQRQMPQRGQGWGCELQEFCAGMHSGSTFANLGDDNNP